MAWQIFTLDPKDPASALVRFKANHWIGLTMTVGMVTDWLL
jgi:4-hydroxybenzoate polyprenyltransferase